VNNVIVLAGKDKGMTGEISSVDPKVRQSNRRWRNIAIRHVKQMPDKPGWSHTQGDANQLSTSRLWMRTAKQRASALKWTTTTRSALRQDNGM
jgi:ribosomal protein L24